MVDNSVLTAVDLGRIPYHDAWELQRRLVEARRQDRCGDLLLFCEHDEVVTQGRKATGPTRSPDEDVSAVRAAEIPVFQVERGGAATYHGPGQLVGYPIVRLAEGERDLHRFLRHLEGALIETLDELTRLGAGRREGLTGVWVGERKLASIGIACRGWVTYHGFALNLSTDLSRFTLFRPCDLEAQVMASLTSLGHEIERDKVARQVHSALAARLGRRPVTGELPEH